MLLIEGVAQIAGSLHIRVIKERVNKEMDPNQNQPPVPVNVLVDCNNFNQNENRNHAELTSVTQICE